MDLATGALGMLSNKLLNLLKEEYNLQKGVRMQVQTLSWELQSMHAALRKVAAVPMDQLDEQVKIWARELREASYDMEDIVDTFMVRVDRYEPADLSKLKSIMKKIVNLFSKGKARHDISCAIEDIKKQVDEANQRRVRYKIDDLVAKPASITSIDPRLSALYAKVSQLVGIEEPREKVIKMLKVGNDMETKIVSIYGFGGLGKTTLAKAVYENLTEDVHVKAFVPVGQNPDLNKVLKDILIGLDKQRYMMEFNLAILDERQLINEVREFLVDKRYFIVIDDIWDVPSWNIIKYALDDNGLGSKIVITTRKHDVAMNVGCSYKLEPLPYECSKELFYGRIFGSEDKCPKQFVDISEKVIKKCGGVPLAIITTSSLLSNKLGNMKEWHEFCESIGSGLGSNTDMENMRKILSLSYYDLPAHLKTCLLYLCTFPEDYIIRKTRLIWRWIAEDFVRHGEGGQSLFEIGESYFNELVNRSLIQPAKVAPWRDMPEFCQVHDMVLDLLCPLAREENFVAIVFGDTNQSKTHWGGKVHRLSLHNSTWPLMDISKLRSLTLFSCAKISSIPSLSCCHLRVLDLEAGCNLEGHPSLSFIGNLFHLRYLGIGDTGYGGELPAEIGKVQLLQTLNIFGTHIKQLPSSIVGLRRLMCLNLNWVTCLPNRLRNLTSLEELRCAIVDSGRVAEELGHLKQLRIVTVKLKMDAEGGCDESCRALVGSLRKLQRIQGLVVESELVMNLEGTVECLGCLTYLRIRKTSLLPTWINPGSLIRLSHLYITVAQVRKEDIQAIGMLQVLRFLEVSVCGGDMQVLGRFMVARDAFPCAKECTFNGFSVVPSMFPRGAAPCLEKFGFRIRPKDFSEGELTTDDLALGHLTSLRNVSVDLIAKEEMLMKLKEKLRHEADVHPNNPSICGI